MDQYLTKPVQINVLRDALTQYLPEPAQSRADFSNNVESKPDAILDLNILKGLVGDDETVIHDLLNHYLENASSNHQEIIKAVKNDNTREIAGIAHKFKSSSRSVGAMNLDLRTS